MPIFAQYGVSNQRLLARFVPVAQEVDYFSDLRMFHDFVTWENSLTVETIPHTDPTIANVIVVGYTNPPAGAPPEVWLLAFNRNPSTPVKFKLTFTGDLGLLPEPQIFRPMRFGVEDTAHAVIDAYNLSGEFTLAGERIAMFKREPFVP